MTTDLSSLFIVCSHGRRSAHGLNLDILEDAEMTYQRKWCPGGRPATLEDLGGEKVDWCEVHKSPQADATGCESWWLNTSDYPVGVAGEPPCSFGERILIPLPQMVAGESL